MFISRRARLLPVCILLLISGCVTRRTVKQNVASKPVQFEVKPATLSDYIRTIYKLSSEASKQAEERSLLLADDPQLEPLVVQAEADPTNTDARTRVVSEYMSRHLYWGAYELLTNTLPDHANDEVTNLNLAIIWDAWGQYDLATLYGERAIANGMATAQAFETMGQIALHQNQPDQAIAWYKQSLDQSRTASALANLGYAFMLKSEWEESKVNLESAIALDDTLQEAHNNLAIVLSKMGDDTGALAQLLETARPAVAFNNLGVLYLEKKGLRDAQHYFEEALRLEPDYEMAQRNLDAVQLSLAPLPILDLATLITPVSSMAQPSFAPPPLEQNELRDPEERTTSFAPRQKSAATIKPERVNPTGAAPAERPKISREVPERPAAARSSGNYRLISIGLAGLIVVAGLLVLRLRKAPIS
jgi:tetratricopeptide (TPR) repeat protein